MQEVILDQKEDINRYAACEIDERPQVANQIRRPDAIDAQEFWIASILCVWPLGHTRAPKVVVQRCTLNTLYLD